MATLFLTDRFMRAAEALLQHGERVEVRYVGRGEQRNCLLLGRGEAAGTVRIGIWCEAGEIREGSRPVVFTDCLLPVGTQIRLEQVAREQDPTPPATEWERTMLFIAGARQQRTRDGRFADCTHRAEPAGVR